MRRKGMSNFYAASSGKNRSQQEVKEASLSYRIYQKEYHANKAKLATCYILLVSRKC
jgi:hypothetical protein